MELFNDFVGVGADAWKEKILKELKLSNFDELIKEVDGIEIKPFYTTKDASKDSPSVRNDKGWGTCQYIVVSDEKEANKQALNALQEGASGLIFSIDKKIDLVVLLKNIVLENIHSQFNISNDAIHILKDLKKKYLQKNTFNKRATCYVNIDPIHLLAKYGEWHENKNADLKSIETLKHFSVNAILYKEAGASILTELALTLAHLNEYFNYCETIKCESKEMILVSFSIGNDFFLEIAKFRAFRKLVALLQKQYGTNIDLHIHAQSAQLNKSTLDSFTNLLRTTTEAMSASIAGCDSIAVLPYNAGFSKNDGFANRIAKNQLHILREESFMDKVADSSNGSYYIESITDEIATKAWELFKEIEMKGGFLTCFESKFIHSMIEKDAALKLKEVEENKRVLVGVNKYQNLNEKNKTTRIKNNSAYKNAIHPINLAQNFE
jgi:methylmalonyl-CoA mutase